MWNSNESKRERNGRTLNKKSGLFILNFTKYKARKPLKRTDYSQNGNSDWDTIGIEKNLQEMKITIWGKEWLTLDLTSFKIEVFRTDLLFITYKHFGVYLNPSHILDCKKTFCGWILH